MEEALQGRFKDAKWANANLNITVGGAGGIGSWLTLFLSRLGNNKIVLFDDDNIEAHNVGGQLYKVSDIGDSKVGSIAKTITEFSGTDIATMPTKYVGQAWSNVMFAAFDNIEARKTMAERWYTYQMQKREAGTASKSDINVFIDGRMEAEQFIIYTVDSISDYNKYIAELFDDAEVDDAPCTFRATTHNAAILAGNMVAIFTNVISNKMMGGKFREVPFKVTFEVPTMTYDLVL